MRTTARLGVFVAATALLMVACTDDAPTPPERAIIAGWQARLEGQTVSYHINVGCFCPANGEWRVVERDGEVVEAEFLGEGEPGGDTPSITLSEALRSATGADEVDFSDVTDTGFGLSVDQEKDAVDDEFSITVTEFVVEA